MMFSDSLEERILHSNILIVDDVELHRQVIGHILKTNGFTHVNYAANGKDALDKTINGKPDLVILDLLMPQMSGYEYCEAIRAMPAFLHLPVLIQTGVDSQEERLQSFKAGATDMILKLVDPSEVIARTRVHLEKKYLLQDLQAYQDRVTHELSSARDMQMQIMPSLTELRQYEQSHQLGITGFFHPSSELGGDFWGCRPIGNDLFGFYSSDFSGHGVGAAMNTFRMHGMLQKVFYMAANPSRLLEELNQQLRPLLSRQHFATMFFGVFDLERNMLMYSAAGTPPAILVQKDRCTLLDGTGMPLGAADSPRYLTRQVPCEVGDSLIIFSDALTETPDNQGRFLNESDVADVVEREVLRRGFHDDAPQEVLLRTMLNCLWQHAPGPLRDDLTISVYHRMAA